MATIHIEALKHLSPGQRTMAWAEIRHRVKDGEDLDEVVREIAARDE